MFSRPGAHHISFLGHQFSSLKKERRVKSSVVLKPLYPASESPGGSDSAALE